jgi:hypothetical protein
LLLIVSLINRLKSSLPDCSQVGSVVADIRFLTKYFVVASLCHVSRVLNKVAHILARSCVDSSLGFILNCAPDCIQKTLCINDF